MPSIIQADQLKSADGVTTYLNSGTLSNLTFPGPGTGADGGHILQMKSASFTGIQTVSSLVDITDLSCSMTITSGNKVWIQANINTGYAEDSYGYLNVCDGSNNVILQNTTGTGNQTNASITVTPSIAGSKDVYLSQNQAFSYLWTPGVTAITVKVRGAKTWNGNLYINRMEATNNAGHVIRGTSTLNIFEVQA